MQTDFAMRPVLNFLARSCTTRFISTHLVCQRRWTTKIDFTILPPNPKFHLKTQKVQATGKLYNVGLESICSVLAMKKMTLTKWHSSRMLTSRLPTLRGGGRLGNPPPVQYGTSQASLNMSRAQSSRTLYGGGGGMGEWEVGGYLYREVQVEHVGGVPCHRYPCCIDPQYTGMPSPWKEWQTRLKTLPSHNLVGGWWDWPESRGGRGRLTYSDPPKSSNVSHCFNFFMKTNWRWSESSVTFTSVTGWEKHVDIKKPQSVGIQCTEKELPSQSENHPVLRILYSCCWKLIQPMS